MKSKMDVNDDATGIAFIRARQRYWKEMVKKFHPEVEVLEESQTPIETNFIIMAEGPSGSLAVFEDEGDTGYLYLCSPQAERVLRHVHIYDRSINLDVRADDAEVTWTPDGRKCGARIFHELRAIIDVERGLETRAWLKNQETPGIQDQQWLSGF